MPTSPPKPFTFNPAIHGSWPQRAPLESWCRAADGFLARDAEYRRGTLAADIVSLHKDTRAQFARNLYAKGDAITSAEEIDDGRTRAQFHAGRAEYCRRSRALRDVFEPGWRSTAAAGTNATTKARGNARA